MQDLMNKLSLSNKLALSKRIMDKHNEVPRGISNGQLPMNENVNYNIPQDVMEQPQQPQQPRIQETINTKPINEDAVMSSKLPDEIKRLMIENPIVQPSLNGPTLSEDVIEGAARLMNNNNTKKVVESTNTTSNYDDLKQMIRDVVRDTVRDVVKEELQSAGLLSESSQKTNDTLSLRVGKHIFEGKVLKVKKIKQ